MRKGSRPTAKTATQSDMDEMMRDLFIECCQGKSSSAHYVSPDGLLMNIDQFMKLLEAARLIDDNVKLDTVEPLFEKVVNHANHGKKKFSKRVNLPGMVSVLKEVAYLKFSTMSEAGRWNKLQRYYLFRLREDILATQNATNAAAENGGLSVSGIVSRPQVTEFLEKHRLSLLKIFRRYAHLEAGRDGKSMREGNATLSIPQLQALAEDHATWESHMDNFASYIWNPRSSVEVS